MRLVQLLEKNVGFEPVTEVALEISGKLARRNGRLSFEVNGSGQDLAVAKVEGDKPPEAKLVDVVATLAKPWSANKILIRRWKAEAEASTNVQSPPRAVRTAIAEFKIAGMT